MMDENPNAFLDSLLESYAPREETFAVALPKGETLTFRAFQSYGEMETFKRELSAFGRKMNAIGDAPGHPFFALYQPKTPSEYVAAYTIHALCVDPVFSIPQAFGLLKAPWLVNTIMDQIDDHRMAYLAGEWEKVEEEKKDSGTTPQEEPPSSSE
jgi:hypothetical protein